MPTIVVRAEHDGDSGPETLVERVITANISDSYYAGQLIERLTWATLDAENLEEASHRTDTNTSAGPRRATVDRPLRSPMARDPRQRRDAKIVPHKSSDLVRNG
jgi:hypothetical protein